ALANPDLRIMTTASPATLLRIAELAHEEQAALIKDFRDGGISVGGVTHQVPALVARQLAKPDLTTARRLESLANEGEFVARCFWPNLKLLACWTGGTMRHFKPVLQDYYGQV